MVCKIIRCLFFVLFFPSTFLFSSNFHEHLFSVPFPSHIATEHEAIFSLPEEKQSLSCFFSTETELRKKLSLQWDAKQIQGITLETTLKTLCYILPGSPKKNLQKLLTFTATKKSPCSLRKFDYETCETLRKNIFLALPIDPFLRIFTSYFQEEPLINREVISATVTRRFFLPKQKTKHVALVHLARRFNTRLIYTVSLQRTTLLKKGIALPEEVLAQLHDRTIGGIDIVGSLYEETYTYPFTKQEMQKRLCSLFDFIQRHHLVVVFHLFEGQNDGPFYNALKETLTTWNKPLFLEVGHIASLNKEWIHLFASNPSLHTLFHCNPQSNAFLQDTPIPQLKKLTQALVKEGFPVVMGSDGRGILPASSYREQKRLISTRFSTFSFLSNVLFTKKWTESPEPVY